MKYKRKWKQPTEHWVNALNKKLRCIKFETPHAGLFGSDCPFSPEFVFFSEETSLHTPKSSQMTQPSVPPLVKTSLFSSKLCTPDVASPLGTPLGSSVMNRMAGIFDINTCYGSPQSPHLIRRGPRLWTSASGEDCLFSKI